MGVLKIEKAKLFFLVSWFQAIILIIFLGFYNLAFPDFVQASTIIVIDEPTDGSAINQTSITVKGRTSAGLVVQVFLNDISQGVTMADIDGNWSYNLTSLTEGVYKLSAKTTDIGGMLVTSNIVTVTIDLTPPKINISSPLQGEYINRMKIQGSTEPFLTVKVFLNQVEYNTTSDANGYWYILNEELTDGTYDVFAQAIDIAGNIGQSSTYNFTFDSSRPKVSLAMSPPPYMTRVDINSYVRIQVDDSSPLDSSNTSEGIELFLGEDDTKIENKVSGVVSFDEVNKVFTFTPSEPLLSLTKYKVRVNPLLTDQAGNFISPRIWTFTTYGIYYNDNPHGAYLTNTNTCKNCHSNHRSPGSKLQAPIYSSEQETDNFCNACHDGTAGPIPSNWNSVHKHNFKITNQETDKVSTSCSTCHNPHVTWSQENPNLLLDAYYYDHNDPTNQFLPNNSREQLCESCHEPNIYTHESVTYQVLTYKNWHNSTGSGADYNLCLNCHNGSKSVDIASYYNSTSGHQILALDGSPLQGHMPCSECHNSHGSNNLKLLKDRLGHSKIKQFTTNSVEWDIATERLFCNSCHNNETEVYGITVSFDSNIEGHQSSSQSYCHACHGGSAIAAAHSPSLANSK